MEPKTILLLYRVVHGMLLIGLLMFSLVAGFVMVDTAEATFYTPHRDNIYLFALLINMGVSLLVTILGYRIFKNLAKRKREKPAIQMGLYGLGYLLGWAFLDGAALFGGVSYIIHRSYVFILITAFLFLIMLLHFPTMKRYKKAMGITPAGKR